MEGIIVKCDIEKKLKKIFFKRFEIDLDTYPQSVLNTDFLSKGIGFTPPDLLYLFSDVESEFNIKIPEEDIVSYRFNNFNNVVEIIHKQVGKNNAARFSTATKVVAI